VRLLSFVFLLLLACAAGEVSQITGVLLVFALLVMPAAAAQQLTAHPARSFTLTIVIGLGVTWLGLGVAYFSPYPVGFWVTTFGFVAYVLAVASRATRARVSRHALRNPAVTS
jgi:zinc/manganese transport system permease protein